MNKIHLGIVGAGVVGGSLIELVQSQKEHLEKTYGLSVILEKVVTRTPSKISFPATTNPKEVWENPKIDLVCELIGGTTTAYDVIKNSLLNKKTVVTANKALLSEKGEELFSLAEKEGVEIGYEASSGGSIPIIRTLRNGIVGNDFQIIAGILNGTTNFILTKMELESWDYPTALRKAQELGFAEADPTFDVEGLDAGQKLGLIASLAFKANIPFSQIYSEGITKISATDIKIANSLGYRIKLLAIAKKWNQGILVKVTPVLLPLQHPLSSIMNEMNAIYYRTTSSGSGMILGKGAGGFPTASAVLSDVLYYGMRRYTSKSNFEKNLFPKAIILEPNESVVRAYLRFKTMDKPGVLSMIAKVLGENDISISYVKQEESDEPVVELVVLTHETTERQIQKSLANFETLSNIIKEKPVYIRLVDEL